MGCPSPPAGPMVHRNLWILARQSQGTNPGRHWEDQPATGVCPRSLHLQRTSSL
uniref:Uncharacterized protein n=1 Tax=Romanomermis culicivorax TaxID=13658 RepID=A0A915HSY7_ROMCU